MISEFIFAIALICAIIYILLPLYTARQNVQTLILEDPNYTYLQEKKLTSYRNLQDLDLDYSIGKVSQGDYERIRREFKQEAAYVLCEMDKLDQEIEKELSVLKIKISCPSCQSLPPEDAKFCPQCGQKMIKKGEA